LYYVTENSENIWKIQHVLSKDEKSIKINELDDFWWVLIYLPNERKALGIEISK